MREIKFRAWDTEVKQNISWNEIKPYLNCIILDETLILMQYTGLKDKDGKEIYEGDIVESNWNNAIEEIKDIRSVDWLLSDGFLAGQENDGCLMGARVIGNIYENPELIELQVAT